MNLSTDTSFKVLTKPITLLAYSADFATNSTNVRHRGHVPQVHVNPEHRNFLRFLWWENGRIDTEPTEYRMTVHLFGATSSPGCANYALKKAESDYEDQCGREAGGFVKTNFYVDDG